MDVITRDSAKEDEPKDNKAAASAVRCGILVLPLPIIFDILLRLPLRAILSCKCVCRTFLEVLRDPYFSEDLLMKSSRFSRKLVFRQGQESSPEKCSCYLASLFDLETSLAMPERSAYVQCEYAAPTIQYQFTSGDGVMFVGSCNGLLCLMPYNYNEPINTYYICNPLLGEFIVTPPVTQVIPDHTYSNFARFVFSPRSKQYKIVHFVGKKFFSDPLKSALAEIYTIGSESWSSTKEVPSPVAPPTLDSCLNGVLHWVCQTEEASELICAFDLDTEKFQLVSPPAHLDSDFLSEIYYISVGVLNGRLCLCYYWEDDASFEVWVMKDYGAAESWTMMFDIDLTKHELIIPGDFETLISFLDDGDLLLFKRADLFLASYDVRTGTFRWYKPLRSGRMFVFAHSPSLVSLKVIGDGKCADSVKQIRKAGFGWIGYLDN